jgi:hypothetical protein
MSLDIQIDWWKKSLWWGRNNMNKIQFLFKIVLLAIALLTLFVIATQPKRMYDARYEAFLQCSTSHRVEDCAQLFGK